MWRIWKTWKSMSAARKAVTVIQIAASAAVLVLAVLQLLGVWARAIDVFIPLLGVMNLCQAYLYWGSDRKVALFSLSTAVFIFICAAAVLFL